MQGELRQERWEKDGQKQSKVRINANNIQLWAGRRRQPPGQSSPASQHAGRVQHEIPSRGNDI